MHFPPPQKMKVQMRHGLPRSLSTVDDEPVAVGDAQLLGQADCHNMKVAE